MDVSANNRPMRIIVFGANGRIGRAVYEAALHRFPQAEIVACVRRRHLHFEGCTGDTKHRSVVFDVFKDDWSKLGKADVLVNCIGAISDTATDSLQKVHHTLAALLCSHRQQLGNPRIIQVSALGVDVHSASAFLRTKAMADELLLAQADTFVVRPSVVCTPDTLIAKKLQQTARLLRWSFNRLPVPKQVMQFRISPVMPHDLAAVVVATMEGNPPQRIIPVAGPQQYTFNDLLQLARPGAKLVVLPDPFFRVLHTILYPLVKNLFPREELALIGTDSSTAETGNAVFSETKMFWITVLGNKHVKHGVF
jgi:uncharacterized protein YbjT (DUF2867 family)